MADRKAKAAAVEAVPVNVDTKKRGKKSQYSDEQKKGFADLIESGRKQDVRWEEILSGAKGLGFKGSLVYLRTFAPKGVLKKRRKLAAKSAPETIKGRGGRPKGSKNKVKGVAYRPVGRGKLTGLGNSLLGINQIVAAMVDEQVATKIGKAFAILTSATEELKKL